MKYGEEIKPEDTKDKKEQEEREYENARRTAYHQRMHGGPQTGYVTTAHQWGNKPTEPSPEPAAPQPAHEKRFPTGGRGNPFGGGILPSGMRGGPRR